MIVNQVNQENIIFLASASEDSLYVKQLYRKLKNNGLNPWSYEENLNPGEVWKKKTDTVIKNSRFFLACLSHQSISKNGYIQRELRIALSELEKKAPNETWFIPVLIEKDVEIPDTTVGTINLSDYQAVDITNEEGLQKLIHQLKTQTNTIKAIQKKEDSKQKIKNYVGEYQIDTALELLKRYAQERNPELINDTFLISSRYHHLMIQNNRGIITNEQHLLERNRITHAILELLG